MKSEEDIKADFWTQKVNWLQNVLRYGAPAFEIDQLYHALLKAGWNEGQVIKTCTRSFFGTECPSLQMSICQTHDISVVQNPGIQTFDMMIQAGREPISLTGASIESVVGLVKSYSDHYPLYNEALEKLLETYRNAAREEAKRQKLKKVALTNIHLVLPGIFKKISYPHYLKAGETEACLYVRLKVGKTLEIKLPYADFQKYLPRIPSTIEFMEKTLEECPLTVNLSDIDFWNGEGFELEGSPNK